LSFLSQIAPFSLFWILSFFGQFEAFLMEFSG